MKRSVRLLTITAMLSLLLTPSVRAQEARPSASDTTRSFVDAEVDSLLTAYEDLKWEFSTYKAASERTITELSADNKYLARENKLLSQMVRKWYDDPRLWFLAGAFSAVLVMSAALNLSF